MKDFARERTRTPLEGHQNIKACSGDLPWLWRRKNGHSIDDSFCKWPHPPQETASHGKHSRLERKRELYCITQRKGKLEGKGGAMCSQFCSRKELKSGNCRCGRCDPATGGTKA